MTDDVDIFLEHFGVKENEELDLFLEHFGVKGMHWGVRKGKDTPADKKAKREGKAKRYVDESKQLQSQINAIGPTTTTKKFKQVAKLSDKKRVADENADLKRQGKLTKKTKHRLVAAGVVAGILATYVTYDSIQSGNARRLATKGKAFVESRGKAKFSFKKNPALANPDLSEDDILRMVVHPTNPGFDTSPGAKMNCRRATMAYEMRRRGYDVEATQTTNARGQNLVGLRNALHPEEKVRRTDHDAISARMIVERFTKPKNPLSEQLETNNIGRIKVRPNEIFEGLNEEPNGARGELSVIWSGGRGGHSMAWERVKGKTVIFDAQAGKKFEEGSAEFKELMDNMDDSAYTRLDNVPLNIDYLMRWVKNAGH